MATNYIFHSTCYDRELLRKEEICLNENHIDYQVEIKESRRQARAPLAGFFEGDIRINERDYDKADLLLKKIIERFS